LKDSALKAENGTRKMTTARKKLSERLKNMLIKPFLKTTFELVFVEPGSPCCQTIIYLGDFDLLGVVLKP
jgi:hypothetical protein